MATEFQCPSGHRWQGDPDAEGWLAACPECGAAGLPQATVIVQEGATIYPDVSVPGSTIYPDPVATSCGVKVRIPGYEVLGELGRGGMGVVYLARQVKLGRMVALKMLPPSPDMDPRVRKRFQIEAEAVAAMAHPNVVQIFELGEVEGVPWFAMEYVAGGSLAGRLRGKPQPAMESAGLVAVLARAVEHAHQRGVLHRDLKPGNVLIQSLTTKHTKDTKKDKEEPNYSSSASFLCGSCVSWLDSSVLKITDFGLARRLDASGATRAGEIVGTPSYMAPEQASGVTTQPGPSIDVWALGAILYECLTGRPPFLGETAMDTVLQVLADEPLPPRRLNPVTPMDLETITLKCLQKEPRNRYASAADLANDLDRFTRGEPILARPVSARERAWKWAKRRPVTASFLGFAVVALTSLVTLGVLYNASVRRQRDVVTRLFNEAETARDEEQRQRHNAEERLLGQYLARSTRLLEQGDALAAVPYQVEALALGAKVPEREKLQRLRIGSTLANTPRLVQLWRHDGAVHAIDFSPDGLLVVSGGEEGTACLWDVGSGRRLREWKHAAGVRHVTFHPAGKLLATADAGGAVRTWDVAKGTPVGKPHQHQGAVTALAFSGDGRRLLSASRDGTLCLHDVARDEKRILAGHRPNAILHASFSPDGQRLVTAGDDGLARLWACDSGEPVGAPMQHPFPVHQATFSPDGKQLYTACGHFRGGGGTGQMIAWDLATGKANPLPLRLGIRRFTLSGDGKRLAAALSSGQVQIWDVTLVEPAQNEVHNGPILDVTFARDDRRILTTATDGTAIVWEQHGRLLRVTPALRHGAQVERGRFSADGRLVLTCAADGTVRLWDLAPLAPPVASFHPLCWRGRFRPDGQRLFTSAYDGTSRLWDVVRGQPRSGWLYHGSRMNETRFSPDGQHVATVGNDGSVRLWSANRGELLWLARGHEGSVRDLAFSLDGARIVSGGDDGRVRMWDVRTGRAVGEGLRLPAGVRALEFTRDGKQLVVVAGETVRLCPVEPTLRDTPPLEDAGKAETTLVAARLGSRGLATMQGDGLIRLWDLKTRQPLGPGLRYRTGVGQVFFDPVGQRLALLATDRTASVWDPETGQLLTGPLPHPDPREDNVHQLYSGGFSPDGKLLGVGASNGLARIWDLQMGELLAGVWSFPWPTVASLAFHPEGHQVLASVWSPYGPGVTVVRELVEEGWSLADLRLLALVLSGQRLSEGRFVDGSAREVEEAFATLRRRYPERFTVKPEEEWAWLRWEMETSWATQQTRGLDALLETMRRTEPTNWETELLRGQLAWSRGRAADAAKAFARARQLGGNDQRLWPFEATCRLESEDEAGFRQVCTEVLSRFGATKVPEEALMMARVCLYQPNAVTDFAAVVRLARVADDAAVLGGALLRAGELLEARKHLLSAGKSEQPLGLLFLALAQAKEPEAAGKTLERARKALEKAPREQQAGLALLLREAEFARKHGVRASPD